MRHARRLTVFLVALLLGGAASADDDSAARLEALVDAIESNKTALVAVNLNLDQDESQLFWPVYLAYQEELSALGDRFVQLVEEYTTNFETMDDAQAAKIVEEYLVIEGERAALRRKYFAPLSEALPGRKVARFYQFENKVDAVLRYRLAQGIPVIDFAPGAVATESP
jgi:hypothetical protein